MHIFMSLQGLNFIQSEAIFPSKAFKRTFLLLFPLIFLHYCLVRKKRRCAFRSGWGIKFGPSRVVAKCTNPYTMPHPVYTRSCFLQQFGEDMKASDKRMTSERCAHLSFVAIVNQLEEAWLCFFPALPLIYFGQYMPTIGKRYTQS